MSFETERRAQAIQLAVHLRKGSSIPIGMLLHEAETIEDWIDRGVIEA